MQAAIWGMDHLGTYLRGRKFTLFTDHPPSEKLDKVPTKTLNGLQEVKNIFDLDIIYKKGSEMPANYLSRNLVNAISWEASQLQQANSADPLLKALINYLLKSELPNDAKCQALIRLYANNCFIEDDIVWRHVKQQFEPCQVVIFLPAMFVQDVLTEAHRKLLAGHDGINKTKECLLQCY